MISIDFVHQRWRISALGKANQSVAFLQASCKYQNLVFLDSVVSGFQKNTTLCHQIKESVEDLAEANQARGLWADSLFLPKWFQSIFFWPRQFSAPVQQKSVVITDYLRVEQRLRFLKRIICAARNAGVCEKVFSAILCLKNLTILSKEAGKIRFQVFPLFIFLTYFR